MRCICALYMKYKRSLRLVHVRFTITSVCLNREDSISSDGITSQVLCALRVSVLRRALDCSVLK